MGTHVNYGGDARRASLRAIIIITADIVSNIGGYDLICAGVLRDGYSISKPIVCKDLSSDDPPYRI